MLTKITSKTWRTDRQPTSDNVGTIIDGLVQGNVSKKWKIKIVAETITFTWANAKGVQYPHNYFIVVILNIANYDVDCMLVDKGSSVDVLFYDTLLKMGNLPTLLGGMCGPLSRFLGKPVPVEGIIILPIIVRQPPQWSLVYLTFTIMKGLSVYNAILGQLGLNALHTIISTYYLLKILNSTRS